jgi:hypothetical protein
MANRIRNRAKHRMDRLKKYRAGRSDTPMPPLRPRVRHHSDLAADSIPESLLGLGATLDDLIAEAKFLREGSRKIAAEVLVRTRGWCDANGIVPHPRLESAAEYISRAALIGYRSKIPEGKTEEEVSREALGSILEAVRERDISGITEAILQIQEAMKSSKE